MKKVITSFLLFLISSFSFAEEPISYEIMLSVPCGECTSPKIYTKEVQIKNRTPQETSFDTAEHSNSTLDGYYYFIILPTTLENNKVFLKYLIRGPGDSVEMQTFYGPNNQQIQFPHITYSVENEKILTYGAEPIPIWKRTDGVVVSIRLK